MFSGGGGAEGLNITKVSFSVQYTSQIMTRNLIFLDPCIVV